LSEELERLRAENEALRQELDTAKECALTPLADLEELRDSEALRRSADRILKSLKLGTQAPAYKAVRRALDQFIKDLTQ
jgi:hypothetical protein